MRRSRRSGRSSRHRACLLAWALLCAAPVRGQPSPEAPRQPGGPGVAAAAQTSQGVLLVGPSAQLYEPGEAGVWTREVLGGVAVDVRGSLAVPDGPVFVAGARTPLYRFDNGAWHAHPLPNRGSVVLAQGGAPALAVGRHVYVWKHGAWKRVAGARAAITALWAAAPGRVYAATRHGGLARLQAGRWSVIRHPLPPGDVISLLVGVPNRALYAVARSGAVLRVSPSRARLVSRDDELASFEPHAAATDAQGTLWIAGLLPGAAEPAAAAQPATAQPAASQPSGAPRPAPSRMLLARVRDSRLQVVEPLDWIAPTDRVTALVSPGAGGLLIATRSGLLRYRDAREGWRSGTIGTARSPRRWQGGAAGPARTR